MKPVAALALLVKAVVGMTSVHFDGDYDERTRSLAKTSCSAGVNGLTTRYGWQTQGNVPHFPYIGGWDGGASWNSQYCGSCLAVTYNNKTINVLVVDHIDYGLDMAIAAMDELTEGRATQDSPIYAKAEVVVSAACGVPPRKRSEDALA
ncbi:hypothetical protein B0A48_03565 [Cryoendolithus antarcticus]|uniref:Eliciting plant response-like protein n=1 Tax=Cryoendolithus antarcticus TaxID=1507870 RepID=A0A1V8TKS8_9PEZI|nr:hypothetical protein B0A48_03565 [Cryoendolithus antarcticus]